MTKATEDTTDKARKQGQKLIVAYRRIAQRSNRLRDAGYDIDKERLNEPKEGAEGEAR